MTGFGTGESTRGDVRVKVEIRTVNHRHFDPSIRISRNFTAWEGRVRELLAARLSRGRISVTVDVESDAEGSTFVLDEKVAADYLQMFQFLRDRFGMQGAVDPVLFAQLPEVLQRSGGPTPEETAPEVLDEAVRHALEEVESMRRVEGEALHRDLSDRIQRMNENLDRIERASVDSTVRVRQRLEERVAAIVPAGMEPDAERLATEIALLAEKADISEELVRFRAHNDAFRGFLAKKEPVGKRLDFLLQEMNREANTIGSKAMNAEIAHRVVELKEDIERLREQVQNVE